MSVRTFLTNNLVYIDQNGGEIVSCSRADGLAFNTLNKLEKFVCILSTETNEVVSSRAKKLNSPVFQGVRNKAIALLEISKDNKIDLDNTLYVGNDINDLQAMELCGYTCCPSDSHESIKHISDIVLKTPGGKGVVREILESVFGLDLNIILYK